MLPNGQNSRFNLYSVKREDAESLAKVSNRLLLRDNFHKLVERQALDVYAPEHPPKGSVGTMEVKQGPWWRL